MTKNKPEKYSVDNYSYSNICQLERCKEEQRFCPKCGHPAHIHWHLNSQVQNKEEIEIRTAFMHGHYCRLKNTQIPALDEGRNVFCYTKKTMVNKFRYCEMKWKIKSRKHIPPWLRKRLDES